MTCQPGSVLAPWVRITFEGGSGTTITVGNPMPGDTECGAAIKSFQYSLGTISKGAICRATIVDEQGSSFVNWMSRLVRNVEQGNNRNKMQAQWGWVSVGSGAGLGCQGATQVIASPILTFLPRNINATLQGGKIIYDLDGVDLMQVAQEQHSSKIYKNMFFTQAVEQLGRDSVPPFNVVFLRLNEKGQPVPIQWSQYNDGTFSIYLGPKMDWPCNGLTPLQIIESWLRRVNSQGNKGVVANWDPSPISTAGVVGIATGGLVGGIGAGGIAAAAAGVSGINTSLNANQLVPGRLILWADAYTLCAGETVDPCTRNIRTYIVNGGGCSPVISFHPNVYWNFQAAIQSGGGASPGTAKLPSFEKTPCGLAAAGAAALAGLVTGFGTGPLTVAAGAASIGTGPVGTGATGAIAVSSNEIELRGKLYALAANMNCTNTHFRATQPHRSIEAELRVQGDPSSDLCSPITAYGRYISLVVINPFYLRNLLPDTSGQCPGWTTVTSSACNEFLTNRNWLILGVDHQIREGSYVTTFKLMLPAPGAEAPYIKAGATEAEVSNCQSFRYDDQGPASPDNNLVPPFGGLNLDEIAVGG